MRVFKIFLLIMGLISFSTAQEKDFQFGRFALQFEVKDLLKFDYYNGSVLSMKYHFNNNYALRVGIGGRKTNSTVKEDKYVTSSVETDSLTDHLTKTTTLNEIGLDLTVIRYFFIDQPIKFYIGAGPILNYQLSDNEWKYPFRNIKKSKNHYTTYVFSLRTICGVEWFFHPKMSLNLDYGLISSYYHRKTNREQMEENLSKQKFDSKNWSVQPVELRLGLSLYFK